MTKRKVVRSRKAVRKVAKPVKKTTAITIAKKVLKKSVPPERDTAIVATDRVIQPGAIAVGQLGLVELQLTEHEKTVLEEPVDMTLVKWRAKKKNGPKDTPYLPHPAYTKWFNRAFGMGAWQMVPVSQPGLVEATVTCHYVLHVHGKPVAYAMGEQEYHDNNDAQTYGDAFESTMASALRRVAKRLGVGLELWDRDWVDAKFGRRSTDRSAPQPERRGADQPAASNYNDTRPITDFVERDASTNRISRVGQRQRLWQIKQKGGRSDAEVMTWLAARYNVTRLKDIKRCDYDAICQAIEAPGALELPASTVDGEVVDSIPE